MAMGPRLDTLPLELREKIVAFGSYATLRNLSLTNRALYQACRSRAVIKAILYNHNGRGGRKWRYPCLPVEAPFSHWARYALADLKATETVSDVTVLSRYGDSMRWAPQLMLLQHPFTAHTIIRDHNLLPLHSRSSHIDILYSFCIVMQTLLPDRPALNVIPPLAEKTASARARFLDCLSRRVEWDEPVYGRDMLAAASVAYLALAYFVCDLRDKLARGPPQGTWDGFFHQTSQSPSPTLAVPNSHSIPFPEFMGLPLPFTNDDSMATCHLRKMVHTSFLEDGSEWGGYYSLPTSPFRQATTEVEFDPPMHNIRFTAEWLNNNVILGIDGTGGRDGVGAFTLRGRIAADTGVLTMEKIYVNHGPRWWWVGFLTPFGIIASWCGDTDAWGGWSIVPPWIGGLRSALLRVDVLLITTTPGG
ncbi:MAG: hypothetical protein Q9207_004728 [Kuettlingeria erythrocarpa]